MLEPTKSCLPFPSSTVCASWLHGVALYGAWSSAVNHYQSGVCGVGSGSHVVSDIDGVLTGDTPYWTSDGYGSGRAQPCPDAPQ